MRLLCGGEQRRGGGGGRPAGQQSEGGGGTGVAAGSGGRRHRGGMGGGDGRGSSAGVRKGLLQPRPTGQVACSVVWCGRHTATDKQQTPAAWQYPARPGSFMRVIEEQSREPTSVGHPRDTCLAVPDVGVVHAVSGQDAPERGAAAVVHERQPREGARQVLLDLGQPHLRRYRSAKHRGRARAGAGVGRGGGRSGEWGWEWRWGRARCAADGPRWGQARASHRLTAPCIQRSQQASEGLSQHPLPRP